MTAEQAEQAYSLIQYSSGILQRKETEIYSIAYLVAVGFFHSTSYKKWAILKIID